MNPVGHILAVSLNDYISNSDKLVYHILLWGGRQEVADIARTFT